MEKIASKELGRIILIYFIIGTRAERECLYGTDDWRGKRSKKIICTDEL